ncbi:MAG TPA: hypothetical protein VFG94_05580, partial [Acidimicrobiales bacterium]|nr:hypothetical protein [Acidimicrobiales bacterium]
IFYRDGMVSFAPYTNVRITVVQPSPFRPPRSATVRFTRAGGPGLTLHYTFRSAYAHDVEMEYDCATGVTPVTTFDVGSHPNRPATLPSSTISIERVFERAGFRVSRSNGDNIVPLAGAGANALWSDAEMHDAMQTYWSRFANVPQWAVWTFFAALSDQGTGLGGIMFDDIGPNHRQGTAVFEDSFISTPPAGDPNGAAAVARMRFWTAVHELGHTFNLAHSWQKTLSIGTRGPWIPLVDNNEARSFMSYPFRVSGGPTAFFSDFEYRFGDDELLFMRHAPSRFVQQGNAAWFDHHGFSQAEVSAEPALRLELRVHRDDWQGIPTFGFLEPVYIEMKLTNVSLQPQLVDEHVLLDRSAMAVVVKREGKEAQLRLPMAAYCNVPSIIALEPGASLYESMLASVTKGGWMIDEPGRYLVQVALELPTGEHLVSNPLTIRVAPPKQVEHERLASDYLTEDVARIYSFGGSRVLKAGNEALQEVAARMGDEPVARHAHLMLGRPLADDFKLLKMRSAQSPMEVKAACEVGAEIRKDKADIPAAEEHLLAALDDAPVAAETLGHIRFKRSVDRFSTMLEEQGELKVAAAVVGQAKRALEARGVIQPVVDELADRHERLLAADGGGTTAARRRRSSGGAKEAKAAGETRTAKATRATRATKAVTAAAPARKSAPRRRATTR